MKTQHQRDGDLNEANIVNRNTETIPLDLTIEILKRLPAESIFRFRCVSKQWCSITRSRFFIDSFMSLSLSRPRFLVCCDLIQYNSSNKNRFLCLSTPLLPQVSNDSSLVSKHEMLVLKNDRSLILRFYNSVRGIICISLGEICERRLFLICNPTTRQVLRIPNDITGFDPTYEYSYMYLGYDTRKGQYKILRIMMSEYGLVKHSVCTLEGDQIKSSSFSYWRHVECNISYRRHESHCNQVLCINGVVYYAAMKRTSSGCNSFVIVSFDVGVEQLFLTESPKEIEKLDHLQLINYKGKLALFSVNKDNNSYTLCVLDDIKKQIWLTKTGLLSPSFCDSYWNLELMTCGGTTEAGEICFMSSLKRADAPEIFFYDLKKNNFRSRVIVEGITNMCNRNSDGFWFLSTSCDHVDNLISF